MGIAMVSNLLMLLAQIGTGAIISYQVDVFDISVDPSAVGKPVWTMTAPTSTVVCNQLPLPAPTKLTQINPKSIYWNDPVNVGKICILTTPLLGTIPILGPSNYILTVTPIDDRGLSAARSNISLPFNNTVPISLTGVGVK